MFRYPKVIVFLTLYLLFANSISGNIISSNPKKYSVLGFHFCLSASLLNEAYNSSTTSSTLLSEDYKKYVLDSEARESKFLLDKRRSKIIINSLILLAALSVIVALVASYFYNQKRKLSLLLGEQNEEIRTQNEEITAQNEEIIAQNEEIETQRENLFQLNEQLLNQNEIIKKNLVEIEEHRNSLANLAWELQEKAELNEKQRDVLVQQKKHITDSIIYAERIQRALLLSNEGIRQIFSDSFVFHKPKNIISGDFYWVNEIRGYKIFAVADCTGHGVPGGIMSMLGMAYLNDIINKEYITKSSDVLEELRIRIIQSLRQYSNGRDSIESYDGMDMAMCALNTETMELQYAGAFLPLYLYRNNGSIAKEPMIFKEDRMPVSQYMKNEPFKNNTIKVQKGDMIYLFSDGYPDQFSQEGKKYNISRFRTLLSSIHHLNADQQENIITSKFEEWKGDHFQVDDVLVMGIRI